MLKLSQVDHACMDHTGGSSVQVDICPVTASFTWHNVLKVHPGFCTLQDFLPFKGQIIFCLCICGIFLVHAFIQALLKNFNFLL